MSKVLVAGATGVVGSSVARAFVEAGWEVHGLSRRPPVALQASIASHAADVTDPAACARLRNVIGDVDELCFCAVSDAPGALVEKWTDRNQVQHNAVMLANLLDRFAGARRLRHVSIVHGTRAYAVHIPEAEIALPLYENQPRIPHENYYFAQEDEVARRAAGQNWSWSIFRAPLILGGGAGSGHNSFLALGVVAAVARDQGRALDYPGVADGAIFEVVDADLLGRAFVWAAHAANARNQIFNISNGDVASWRSLWPVIAAANGVAAGSVIAGYSYARAIPAMTPVWKRLVARHDLVAPTDLTAFLGESFALVDFGVLARRTNILSTIKLRKAGFTEVQDTHERVRAWYDRWRRERLLPPLG